MMELTVQDIETEMLDILEHELAAHDLSGHSPILADMLRSYVTRPGKRVRPQVLTAASHAYGYSDITVLKRIAAATELLHVFAIMHDDRIDGASRVPQHATASDTPELRQHYEVLGGDILHTVAYAVLVEAVHDFGITHEILRTIRHVSVATIGGQAMDIEFLHEKAPEPTVERLKTLYDRKTGYYSFVAPLMIASLLAQAPASERENLRRAGFALGRAYQFGDDLADISPYIGRRDGASGTAANAANAANAESDDNCEGTAYWEFNIAGTYLLEREGIDTRSQWHKGESRNRLLSSISPEGLAEFVATHISEELNSARDAVSMLRPEAERKAALERLIDNLQAASNSTWTTRE